MMPRTKLKTAKQLLKRFYDEVPDGSPDQLKEWLCREMPNASDAQRERKSFQIVMADMASGGTLMDLIGYSLLIGGDDLGLDWLLLRKKKGRA